MPEYAHGQIVEIGGDWETTPGSATAYEGTDDENSPPDSWGSEAYQVKQAELQSGAGMLGPDGGVQLNGTRNSTALVEAELYESMIFNGNGDPKTEKTPKPEEPCGLTVGELRAHKAQMVADAEEAKKKAMLHMIIAGVGGYLLSNWMK